MNPKSPLDSQNNKWQTDTTLCSTEYKASKSLITNLETSTELINQEGGTTLDHKMKEIQTKRLKGLKTRS